jgi:hypothetical protein
LHFSFDKNSATHEFTLAFTGVRFAAKRTPVKASVNSCVAEFLSKLKCNVSNGLVLDGWKKKTKKPKQIKLK